MNTRKRLFIFDMDGTLVDSRADITIGVNIMRKQYGLGPLAVETVCSYVGNGPDQLVERALDGIDFSTAEALSVFMDAYSRHANEKTIPYPGVMEGIEQLHTGGDLLAVSTNKPHDCCVSIIRHLGMEHLFCSVIGEGADFRLKPDPEILHHIMKENKTPAESTYMVGDHHTDIEAGKRAGVQSIFLTYGIGKLNHTQPDLSFDSFTEFIKHFV